MNCESIADNMADIVYGRLSREKLAECQRHLFRCPECADAVRGAEALALLRNCGSRDVPDGLFNKFSSALQEPPEAQHVKPRFWLGTGIGGAVAASLFAAVLALGWISLPAGDSPDVAEFRVSVSEPRIMDVAIEADRPLEGASISILLTGGVELDGYGGQRELTWTTDLEAGINRLRLPVVALDDGGGKMVVRLTHPDSEQVYVVRVSAHS